ncbi:hypothetical protein Bhyg_12667 [Pseudolycoriella hygida]|uniref:Uncharacterized protein n=1 Tax=Pseudolycoriella hygida TaxID=35572 RepID=A0A9Q0MZA5_9DIPT|nr:hypothetical protein Bhyg_12667 [Pseudolycoriella hygida]
MRHLTIIIIIICSIMADFVEIFNFGEVIADSRLIYEGIVEEPGEPLFHVSKQITFNTDEDISAIRAADVTGNGGVALMNLFNSRSVQLHFRSGTAGRGFLFRIQIYHNNK